MAQKYSQQFRKACNTEAQRIAAKIGRPLSAREERGIKNICSIMMMESALSDIYAAETPQQAVVALSELASSTGRLQIAVEELEEMLIETFEFSFTSPERGLLLASGNGLDIIIAKEGLIEISNTMLFRKNKARNLIEEMMDEISQRR